MPGVLLVLMGVSLYLIVHNLWMWFANRSEQRYPWIAAWCANSLLYQASRYSQITASSPAQLYASDRAAFTFAVVMLLVMVLMARAVTRVPRSARVTGGLVALTGVVLFVHWTTRLFITPEVTTFRDWFGHTVRFSAVGPLYTPLLLLCAGALYVYGCFVFWRAAHLSVGERLVLIGAVTACLGFGLNDILLYQGLIATMSMFELGFAGIAIGLNFLMVHDIGRVHDRLKKSEQRYRGFVESMVAGVTIVDPQENVVFANAALASMLGLGVDDMVGTNLRELAPEGEFERFAAFTKERRVGLSGTYETTLLHRDGRAVQVMVSASPLTSAEGAFEGVLAVIVDVSGRKRAEARTRLLSQAIEQAAESVVITDTDANILYVNAAFERVTGHTRDEVIGKNPRILKSDRHDREFYVRMWDALTSGRPWTGRLVNRKADGKLFEEDAAIFPVRDEAGTVTNYVAVKRDITVEVAQERLLHQAQKMEAIGQFASGIAHDFNNLITVILGATQLAQVRLSYREAVRRSLATIERSGLSASRLTRSLLAFARQQKLEMSDLDLGSVVAETLPMLERLIPDRIHLEYRPDIAPCGFRGDRNLLQQVLMNLCANARDAMPDGGEIVLETGTAVLGDDFVQSRPWARQGKHSFLSVRDTGCGMDEATLARVFEPFFTTKEPGRGTGLGMASVMGTVKQHGGFVDVASSLGVGSCVTVYLPYVEVARAARETAPAVAVTEVGATVLVVDDDPDILEMVADFLAVKGYAVTRATDGVEALRLLEVSPKRVRAVVSDMSMPGMSGLQLLETARKQWPELPFLFCTGDAARRLSEEAGRERCYWLQKPFELEELGRRLAEVLGGEEPSR